MGSACGPELPQPTSPRRRRPHPPPRGRPTVGVRVRAGPGSRSCPTWWRASSPPTAWSAGRRPRPGRAVAGSRAGAGRRGPRRPRAEEGGVTSRADRAAAPPWSIAAGPAGHTGGMPGGARSTRSVVERAPPVARPPVPARRHLRRRRHQLRHLLGGGRGRRALPVRRRHGGARSPLTEPDRALLPRLPARRAARASATATGSTGRGIRPAACAATRPSSCSTRTPRPSTGRAVASVALLAPAPRPDERRTTDSAPFMPRSVVVNPYFDWAGDRPPRTPLSDTVIYEAHVKGATRRHPEIEPRAARDLRGLAHPAFVDHLHRLGVTAIELLPVHQFIHDAHPRRARPAELLGLQLDRILRTAQRVRRRGQRGEQVQEFKQMVKVAARGRHRGDPRRGLQPHRRRQPLRPDAVVQGDRQHGLLPPDRRRPPPLHGLHGHRQPSTCATRTCCNSSWTACGTGSPRCTWTASGSTSPSALARELHEVDRLSAFFDLIQQDPASAR